MMTTAKKLSPVAAPRKGWISSETTREQRRATFSMLSEMERIKRKMLDGREPVPGVDEAFELATRLVMSAHTALEKRSTSAKLRNAVTRATFAFYAERRSDLQRQAMNVIEAVLAGDVAFGWEGMTDAQFEHSQGLSIAAPIMGLSGTVRHGDTEEHIERACELVRNLTAETRPGRRKGTRTGTKPHSGRRPKRWSVLINDYLNEYGLGSTSAAGLEAACKPANSRPRQSRHA